MRNLIKKVAKKIAVRIIAAAVIVGTVFTTPVFAGSTSGNPDYSSTFTIDTGSNLLGSETVVLKQNKGTAYGAASGTTYSTYWVYDITIRDNSTGKVIKNKCWDDGQFTISTLWLHNNRSYTVTVAPRSVTEYNRKHFVKGMFSTGGFDGWSSKASWYISRTGRNVSVY